MTAVNLNRAVRGPVTAVPVVAGKGVRLVADTANNRFVVEADETVLFDGEGTPVSSATLSESMLNFEKLKIYVAENNSAYAPEEKTVLVRPNATYINIGFVTGQVNCFSAHIRYDITATTITAAKVLDFKADYTSGTAITVGHTASLLTNIYKVVGVNRIASN